MKHVHTGVTRNNPRIFKIWQGLRQRCNNPNDKDYKEYGGRGVSVCVEWDSAFEPFLKWALENGYASNLSIDRVDVNGNYCPENCRWATWTQQARNKRVQKRSTTGVKGVHEDRGRYRAVIYINKKRIDLGHYSTVEEAAAARKAGEILYWGAV